MSFTIKEKREKLGMSQEELSNKSGVSRTTISALENNTTRTTTTKTLLALAAALGTTVDQIFLQ